MTILIAYVAGLVMGLAVIPLGAAQFAALPAGYIRRIKTGPVRVTIYVRGPVHGFVVAPESHYAGEAADGEDEGEDEGDGPARPPG